jgi:hypothetical protein
MGSTLSGNMVGRLTTRKMGVSELGLRKQNELIGRVLRHRVTEKYSSNQVTN